MNNNSLDCIWKSFHSNIKRYAMKICCGSNIDCNDVISITLLKLHEYQVKSAGRHITLALVFLTIRHSFLNELRRSSEKYQVPNIDNEGHEMEHADFTADTSRIFFAREELKSILLQACSETEREILIRLFYMGYSYADTSDQLGISQDACRQRVSYIRKKLVKEHYFDG